MAASARSASVDGATCSTASAGRARAGAGSARLSTLPLGVRGSASSTTTADGTMYSGRRPRAKARSAAGSAPASAAT
jgi:hypothetical protein